MGFFIFVLCERVFLNIFFLHTDGTNDRISSFLGFSLYVSNSTNRLRGTLCFRDTQFNKTTIPEVFNTTCNVFGQYIIYYNERLPGVDYPCDYNINAENDLCEVEVYGKRRFIKNSVNEFKHRYPLLTVVIYERELPSGSLKCDDFNWVLWFTQSLRPPRTGICAKRLIT